MSDMKHNTISRSAHADKQLLRTPRPQPDESLMGYILRLSATNYCETPKWILDLAGLEIYSLKKGWRKLCDDSVDFTLFEQIAKLSEEEVNEMKHEFIRNSDYERCHAQWHVPISSLRFDWPMICPYCLRENPYCRKFWDLRVITVCPQHRLLLLDICPSCQEPITWNRKSVSRCSCGCDWRETIYFTRLWKKSRQFSMAGLRSSTTFVINIQTDIVVIWLRTSTVWPIAQPWRFCASQWRSSG
jgi:TniQ protein